MLTPWLPFEWIVALRFLRQGRLQTLFILAGVAIGVGVIVFMSATLAGLQANFIRRVLSAQAHIQILPHPAVSRPQTATTVTAGRTELVDAVTQPPAQRTQRIDQWQAIMSRLRNLPEIVVISPVTSGSALAIRGDSSRGISLIGIDPELHYAIIHLDEKIIRGRSNLTGTDILIGTDLATDFGVDVGDKLRVNTANGASAILNIIGIFDLGNRGANKQSVFVALKNAQNLLALPGAVTSLEITVTDVYAAETIAQQIAQLTGVEANSWIKTSAQFFAAISAQTTANTAIRFFVGLSVALGITSVLVVSVVQRSREIGILRAMGISQGQILRVFLLQGGLLGLAGSMIGCLIGISALVLWQHLMRNPDGTPMIPLVLNATLFMVTFGLASITGLGAAVAPALRAARLDPVAAIRA
jgi:lipoprotein-releasing system permease protein